MENNDNNFLEIKNLISEVHLITQAPKSIILGSFLSVLSSACQGLLDVEIKPGLITPTSLFLLTLAKSGERKSTVDNILYKKLLDLNKEINEKNEKAKVTYQSEFDRWDIKRKLIQKEYKKSLTNQIDDALTSQLESELLLIHENKPKAILFTNIVYHDITIEALLANLAKYYPNTTLSSSDAGNILNRFNYQYLSHINKLWDGDVIQIERKKEGAIIVQDARISMSLMIQPKVFDDIFNQKKRIRDTGALARMLVIGNESTQGLRPYTEIDEKKYLDAFYNRITEIYKKSLSDYTYGIEKKVIKMTPLAKEEWVKFYNDVETKLGNSGYLSDIDDFASKIANNVARIAALLHYYQHNNLEICKECMFTAVNFGYECTITFKSLFGEKSIDERAKELACILLDWLFKNSQNGRFNFSKREIYTYGPNQLRNKENLEMALWQLHRNGDIFYYVNSKPAFIQFLRINHYIR